MSDPQLTAELQTVLAEQVRGGDRLAERQLVELLAPRLRVVAARRVPPRFIEDVAQETMCAVVQAVKQGRIQDETRLPAFAHGVLRNVISNLMRSEKVRSTREERSARESSHVETETPLDLLISREERLRVAGCLGLLREEDREILLLSYYRALPPREVADRLGIQPNVARQRKWRALQRFAEVYRDDGASGGPARGDDS
jgi:RNA polymerase sigma factor (sigma-70 family)